MSSRAHPPAASLASHSPGVAPTFDAVSTLSRGRLLALRALYLFLAAGLAAMAWPRWLAGPAGRPPMDAVVDAMLVAFSLLCLAGIRQPAAMIPVLLWELAWKTLWLVRVFVPRAWSGSVDAATAANAWACALVVLVPLVVPWRVVAAGWRGR